MLAIETIPSVEVVEKIWPVVEAANQASEAYTRISKDMIRVLPYGCQFPRADKGSVIRQAFYKQFANEIEEAYDAAAASTTDRKVFTGQELENHLRSILTKHIPAAQEIDRTTDLFSLGIDSPQWI